jgi:hypothetical protein
MVQFILRQNLMTTKFKLKESVTSLCAARQGRGLTAVSYQHYYIIVTENTKYALRVANPRAADRPACGWPPEGHIVMTP